MNPREVPRSPLRNKIIHSRLPLQGKFNVASRHHKLRIVAAVRQGLMSRDECISVYGLPAETLDDWLRYTFSRRRYKKRSR